MEGFGNVLHQLREASTHTRGMGDAFERLIKAYLQTDPVYRELYSDIWLWEDFPYRDGKADTGVDLVAKERHTNEYCAIQCKFYGEEYRIQKGDIDSFFTELGRKMYSSGMIVSSTDHWGKHAEDALREQTKPVTRLRLQDLAAAPIDWEAIDLGEPERMTLQSKKRLLPHQQEAHEAVMNGFQQNDRGQMIMACGTGKTYTSLKIAETIAQQKMQSNKRATILFLVPSISLLSQTLREWSGDTTTPFQPFAVCSDTKVTKQNEDIQTHDIGFPATTNVERLKEQFASVQNEPGVSVVFSTYQSIDVVIEAQQEVIGNFDLIICDEAHRTTGVTLSGENESHFVKVHDETNIQGDRRLYMTATPKVYGDDARTKANEHDALLASMDNETLFGPVFHQMGFGEAVKRGLLSDYKVMVLAVDENYIDKRFQQQIANQDYDLTPTDAIKITGCWNGLAKRTDQSGDIKENPMKRAVAFSSSIKQSQRITDLFPEIVDHHIYLDGENDNDLRCEVEHVDGSFNALNRNRKIDWLKQEEKPNTCRILSNARCLTEGVDVPSLDSVMFLNPRNSVVDIVQAVGRVMRKTEEKDYGYIILPIGVPAGTPPEEALNNNEKYKVVWQVLQALRAHDDRFNTTINQIELNKQKPANIDVIGVGGGGEGSETGEKTEKGQETKHVQMELEFPDMEAWRDAIYAKMVQKCGDRRYWESWANDVADIANRHIQRIELLLEDPAGEPRKAFDRFLTEIRSNLNDGIMEQDAIQMLSQHMITKPVFDALFEEYSFVKNNPVSQSMQGMVDILEQQALEKETESLAEFYESVRDRARGVDNAEGKQKIILELYDKFFRNAFPETTDKLGIVYTPTEIVDFMIKSANDALKHEFNLTLSEEGVHVLDPFTGTGTFIIRLLQSGLIHKQDLVRKYTQELHANEIVLLAYYIAAINIEQTYYNVSDNSYSEFEGIVLTDTLKLSDSNNSFDSVMFPENNKRVRKQNNNDIRVIIGNPPYSIGQSDANDNNQNMKYSVLDSSIENTYAKYSSSKLKRGLYDSYIRSIRWASNRIKEKGLICFVTNGAFLDNNGMDGMRKCLRDEFTSIYCFNLRGNQRTSGETSKQEGGKIFGSGSRAGITITLLIKNSHRNRNKAKIYYYDIGDYLSKEEKLQIIKSKESYKNINWQEVFPNKYHDWVNQRSEEFNNYLLIGDFNNRSEETIFRTIANGVVTGRDLWTYAFSKNVLKNRVNKIIDFYNEQRLLKVHQNDFEIDTAPSKIKWTRSLKNKLYANKKLSFQPDNMLLSMYRPFNKRWLYLDTDLNETKGRSPYFLQSNNGEESSSSFVMMFNGVGSSKPFSALVTDVIPNLDTLEKSKCVGLTIYDHEIENTLIDNQKHFKEDNISNQILEKYQNKYKDYSISKLDIFTYIYGLFHSDEYKSKYSINLKKSLPRIPFISHFHSFSKAGRDLVDLHLNYENVTPYPIEEHMTHSPINYRIHKMRFGKSHGKKDKTKIIYNSTITLEGIPEKAYEYQVNGRSAIEWIMDQYQVKTDKASGIVQDPNEYSDDPRYILDLLKRIITVSLKTREIVESMPPLEEIDTEDKS